jgi:phage terminase large subunit-like protein
VVITTPGSNPENHYAELVKQGEAILAGEVEDDTVLPILYGLDPSDQLDEEATWAKANPGLEHGQPDLVSLRRSWNTMKRSAMGRAEFSRYHAARMSEDTGGWLDMALWPGGQAIDWEALRGRPAWCGLDLSKSLDMTALVVSPSRSTTGASRSAATTGGRRPMSRNASSTTGCPSAPGRSRER